MSRPEPIGTTHRDNHSPPFQWTWQEGAFIVAARADAVDVEYDFDGRMGPVSLGVYSPSRARELAAVLLAAADQADAAETP